jgi:hypothetical protein
MVGVSLPIRSDKFATKANARLGLNTPVIHSSSLGAYTASNDYQHSLSHTQAGLDRYEKLKRIEYKLTSFNRYNKVERFLVLLRSRMKGTRAQFTARKADSQPVSE